MQKQTKIRSKKHTTFLRELPCCSCGQSPACGAHIRIGGNAGIGQKPCDSRTVPLCNECHNRQHNRGERTFWGNHLESAEMLANALFFYTGNYEQCLMQVNRFKRLFNANS